MKHNNKMNTQVPSLNLKPTIIKFIDTEKRMVVVKGWREG